MRTSNQSSTTSPLPAKRAPKYRYLCPACGNTAFHLYEMPKEGGPVRATNATSPDGKHYEVGNPIECFSCCKVLNSLSVSRVVPIQ